jgi:hypothetical protein
VLLSAFLCVIAVLPAGSKVVRVAANRFVSWECALVPALEEVVAAVYAWVDFVTSSHPVLKLVAQLPTVLSASQVLTHLAVDFLAKAVSAEVAFGHR